MFVLNEAYFGKTKKLIEIENLIQDLRDKYGTGRDVTTLGIGFGSVESDPLWKKIQDAFCDEFGFTSCYMTLTRTVQPNAATLPISFETSKASSALRDIVIKKHGVGIKYSKNVFAHFYIIISSAILFDDRFTPGECVAIILHEVGHNFQHLTYNQLGPIQNGLFNLYFILCLFSGIIRFDLLIATDTNFRASIINFLRDLRTAFPTLKEAVDFGQNLLENIIAILPLSNVTAMLAIAKYLRTGVDGVSLLTGYADEQASDRFVSYYGYGAELTSALGKFETNPIASERIINQIPLLGSLYSFEKVIFLAILKMFDPHPQFTARYNAVRSELEYNLEKSGIDKSAKKAIQKQIEQVDEAYRVSMEVTPEEGFGESMAKRALKLLSLNPKGDILSWFYSKGSDFSNNYDRLQTESSSLVDEDQV